MANTPTQFFEDTKAAFLELSIQTVNLIDLIEHYFRNYPDDAPELDAQGAIKQAHLTEELKQAMVPLAEVPRRIADEIAAAAEGKPRILSVEGFDVELLNELAIAFSTIFAFMLNQDKISITKLNKVDIEKFAFNLSLLRGFNLIVHTVKPNQ